MLRRAPALASIALALVGCGDSSDGALPSGATVRDSAGIRITTFGTAPDDLPPPVRPAGPTLSLGRLEGEGPDVFGFVGSTRIGPSGRIYVADTQADEVRVFESDGTFVTALGGPGEGPGEFGSPVLIGLAGDSLEVWDSRTRRISIFTLDGGFARAVTLRTDGSLATPAAYGVGWIAQETEVTTDFESTNGFVLFRDSITLRVFDRAGTALPGAVRVPGSESGQEIDASGGTLLRVIRGTTPFMRSTHLASTGERLIGGANDRFEIGIRTAPDSLVAIWRYPGLDATAGDAVDDYLDYLGGLYEDNTEGLRAARERFEGLPIPELRPAFTELRHDPAGRLWVRPFQLRGPSRWLVLDATSGAVVRLVEFSERFLLHEVRDDLAVGMFRDELDVSYVHVYDLRDAASP